MVTLFCLSHLQKILWWIWCEIMLLKFDTVHLFLCWRCVLDTAISSSVPSPLNVGVCKVNQDSAPQTLFQTWNYIIPLFPVLYWCFSREALHILFFKPSSLLRHAACFSQTTGCSIGWHCPAVSVFSPQRLEASAPSRGDRCCCCRASFVFSLSQLSWCWCWEAAGLTLSCCIQRCQFSRK